jgi:DNA-binding transcriptional ArsR family regulator
LLEFLAQGARSVDALAKLSGLSVANTSQHLQVLRQAGLVGARKEGLFVYYSVSGGGVIGYSQRFRRPRRTMSPRSHNSSMPTSPARQPGPRQ